MKYVALLRGINVGTGRGVSMQILKELFAELGFTNISTYINSGNVFFEADPSNHISPTFIEKKLKATFGFDIPTLIKTQKEVTRIAQAIPTGWENNTEQKTDIAYLFEDIDHKDIIAKLPFNHDVMTVKYLKGALLWNLKRSDYTKSRLNRIIGHPLYKSMTIRNTNTARYLGQKNH